MNTNGSNAGTTNSDLPMKRLEYLEDHPDILCKTGSYSAAFVMTVSHIPVIAAIVCVIIYLLIEQSGWSIEQLGWLKVITILGGTLLAFVAWCIAATCFYRSTAIDRANLSSYQQLISRLYQLAVWIETLTCEQQGIPQGSGSAGKIPCNESAIKEVRTTFNAIYNALVKKKNPSWMWAVGYVNIWRLIHRADEALISIEPTKDVIRDALHDEMSIMGSNLENRNDLLNKLRLAVKSLSEQGAMYLNQQPRSINRSNLTLVPHSPVKSIVNLNTQQIASQTVTANKGNHVDDPTTATTHHEVEDAIAVQARTIIREVKFSLHQFRDDRWEKLVRVRNHLIRLTIVTGLAIYLLVVLVILIITNAQLPMLEAATIFYMVGVVVSLFSRLYDQSKTDSSIDDFRLAAARLTAAPTFSGLAAVGGVLIVLKVALTQSPTFPAFELSVANIIVAAVFGLTPGLFVTTFQKQADQYKADLKSTQAPSGEQEKSFPSE